MAFSLLVVAYKPFGAVSVGRDVVVLFSILTTFQILFGQGSLDFQNTSSRMSPTTLFLNDLSLY